MATNNVSSFLQVIGQGVKPNMFNVDIQFPTGFNDATINDLAGGALASEGVAGAEVAQTLSWAERAGSLASKAGTVWEISS